ncbi:MAG: hypothetical protein CL424_16915 [Acidimicrobiaceae bacterium]|nr:hypothetical protein [Acidimicrobiaceae bacterium]
MGADSDCAWRGRTLASHAQTLHVTPAPSNHAVATVVNMVASGMTPAEVVDELPSLELDDVAAALRYAADAVADREIPLQPSA